MKRLGSLLLAACALAGPAQAGPVADALDRPALMVRDPARSVLLGVAHCGGKLLAVGERGIVVSSPDGGASWRQAQVPVSVTLTAVRCPDAQTAYAVGHGGVVLASTDGGQSWTRRFDGRKAAQLALDAARAGGDAKAVQEAQRLVSEGADKPFLDLHFFDARRGVVVGAYGLAFATDDGGQTWQPWMQRLPNPKATHLYALRVRGDTMLIAGEQGLVLRSNDGGRTFMRLELPYTGSFFTAELPGDQEYLVAGLRGNVWRSADGGASWSQLASPTPVSVTASTLGAGRQLLLANQAGEILQLTGAGLVPLKIPPLPPLNALHAGAGSLVAFSLQGAVQLPPPLARP